MQRIHKTISEFVSERAVPSVAPDDVVAKAVETMQSAGSDCVLVIEGEQLIGVFTERDFLNRVTAEQRIPARTAMREVMTPAPHTLGRDDCISYAINCMAVRGFRNVPIVDADKRVIAIISVRDVIDHMADLFDELRSNSEEDGEEWVDIGG